ncbi:MAG: hypothetical protein WBG46_13505 [Nonlabens sp.]
MKKKWIGLIVLLGFMTHAQVNVGVIDGNNNLRPLNPELTKEIKEATLIFVKPKYFKTESVTEILESSWTISPYKIVDYNDFDPLEYQGPNFTVCRIYPHVMPRSNNMGLRYYLVNNQLEFYTLDPDLLTKNIAEIEEDTNSERYNSQIRNALIRSRNAWASISLFDNAASVGDINQSETEQVKQRLRREGLISEAEDQLEIEDIYRTVNEKNYFLNLNQGWLKNYIQAVNDAVENDMVLSRYQNRYGEAVINLKNQRLLIPEYVGLKMSVLDDDVELDQELLAKVLKKYKYDREIVSASEIGQRILNGDDFYYLRYAPVFDWQFIEVVHSTTGKIIFSNHESKSVFTPNFRKKHFKVLSKAID